MELIFIKDLRKNWRKLLGGWGMSGAAARTGSGK